MAKSVAQQAVLIDDEEEEIYVSPQWKLIWRRFRKHRMALVAMGVLAILYIIGLGAEFFSMTHPEDVNTQIGYLYPQNIRWFDQGRLRPHVLGISGGINPETFQREYEVDPTDKIPVKFFARGFEYKFLGFIKVDRHIVATPIDSGRAAPYLLGTDRLGRDLWSRLMYGTRISMSIGLVGVAVSLVLGVSLGGVSGYFGGVADTIIQRIIEIFGSAPKLPLWLGLAAAVPRDWGILKLYFAITLVISLFAWTDTARVVRGKVLSMREEDFVLAARLTGATNRRILFSVYNLYQMRALIYTLQKKHDSAIADLNVAINMGCDDASTYLERGKRRNSWRGDARRIELLGVRGVTVCRYGGRFLRGCLVGYRVQADGGGCQHEASDYDDCEYCE